MHFYRPLFIILIIVISALSNNRVMSQSVDSLHLEFRADALSSLSGVQSDLPFWLHANRFGKVHQYSANLFTTLASSYNTQLTRNIHLAAGTDLLGRIANRSTVHFDQAYIKATFWDMYRLSAGRYHEIIGLADHPLSSGSFMVSPNATPIPKIAIQTNGFKPIPFTRNIFFYNALLAHGWFEDGRWFEDVMLHQKYFYLKIKIWRFQAIGGIVHNVQWGGTSPDGTKYPSDLDAWTRVVLARGAKDDGNTNQGEVGNVLGNSVAAYDFMLITDLNDYELELYRLFYLEDKVAARFRSPWDGMWGAVLHLPKNSFLTSLLYEHINTKKQDSFDFEPRGTSRYYNNFLYRSGWAYQNRVLGNPLLLIDPDIVLPEYPVYNNIIIAHHMGINGQISNYLDFKFLYTYSRNYGNYKDQIIRRLEPGAPIRAILRPLSELKKVNHSFLVSATYNPSSIKQTQFKLDLTADVGELYPSSPRFGIGLGVRHVIF